MVDAPLCERCLRGDTEQYRRSLTSFSGRAVIVIVLAEGELPPGVTELGPAADGAPSADAAAAAAAAAGVGLKLGRRRSQRERRLRTSVRREMPCSSATSVLHLVLGCVENNIIPEGVDSGAVQVYHAGKLLAEPALTLEQCGILAGDEVFLRIDKAADLDKAGGLDQWVSALDAGASSAGGFGGTLLGSSLARR